MVIIEAASHERTLASVSSIWRSQDKRFHCGVFPWRLAAYSAAGGFDASAWLPGEVMARFFQDDKLW
jgi:hypothetical protein